MEHGDADGNVLELNLRRLGENLGRHVARRSAGSGLQWKWRFLESVCGCLWGANAEEWDC